MPRTHGSTLQRRPTIKSPCVADKYHAPGERIAEISFPDGKGALLSLRQDIANGIVLRTRIEVYRQDDGIEVMHGEAKDWKYEGRTPAPPVQPATQPRTQWAAYVGMSSSQGISLHENEISALLVIADTLGLLSEDEDRGKTDPTAEDLRERIEEHCLQGADDWYVQEVP